jgi:hypothetical protein
MRAPLEYEPCDPIVSVWGIVVCPDHRTFGVADIVTDEGWGRITRGIGAAGKVVPDRDRCEVVYVPLDGPDELRLARVLAGGGP